MGSVSQLVNGDGEVWNKFMYQPFGEPKAAGKLLLNRHKEELLHVPFGFTGEAHDFYSGLIYLRTRYYDPGVGSFISRDSYLGDLLRPLSQNRYTYVENNPINYIDPSGHETVFGGNAIEYIQNLLDNPPKPVMESTNQTTILDALDKVVGDAVDTYKEYNLPVIGAGVVGVVLAGDDIYTNPEKSAAGTAIATAAAIGIMELAQPLLKHGKNKKVYQGEEGKKKYTTNQPPPSGPNKPSGGGKLIPLVPKINPVTGTQWDLSKLPQKVRGTLKWLLGIVAADEILKQQLEVNSISEGLRDLPEENESKTTISHQ